MKSEIKKVIWFAFFPIMIGIWSYFMSIEPKIEEITITGTLTDEGVECQALRDDKDKLYTLSNMKLDDLSKFKLGQRVVVIGKTNMTNFCMQGEVLGVISIKEISKN